MRYGNHVFVEQENRRLTTRLQKAEALLAYQKKLPIQIDTGEWREVSN